MVTEDTKQPGKTRLITQRAENEWINSEEVNVNETTETFRQHDGWMNLHHHNVYY